MSPGWNDTLDRLAASIADRLAGTAPTPPPAPPAGPDFGGLFARWEAALDRLDADADLGPVIAELTELRTRLNRLSGTARAATPPTA